MVSVTTARELALDLLRRIDEEGAYANLVVPSALSRATLSKADRALVTNLVYGTTRMRRACDAIAQRFIAEPPDASTARLLRLGVYQWGWGGIAPHAAVHETVSLAPRRTKGFVNAVLRKVVAGATPDDVAWPSDSVRLSMPDWLVERLVSELGQHDAIAACERMNQPPPVTTREDGYTQEVASAWVAQAVGGRAGERILDVCAAPGGKATLIASTGAYVVAADRRPHRASLVQSNRAAVGLAPSSLSVVTCDGLAPSYRPESFDAVLLDAPCSGLGSLRRRADARWRILPSDIEILVELQKGLLNSCAALVAPGGRLVYSVCTVTAAESIEHVVPADFEIDPTPPEGVWRPFGHGWRVLPQDADTDGMVLVRYRRSR